MDLYRRLLSAQIRGQLQYPVSFALDVISVLANTVLWFFTLALLLQRFRNVAGWSLGEIAFLYSLIEVSFGLSDMIFSGFDPDVFGEQVRRGTLDQLLLRPVRITLQVLGSRFLLKRLGRVAQGVAVFALALHLAHPHWTIAKTLYLPVVLSSLVCFFGGLYLVGSTITFWTVQSVEAVNIFTYGGSELMSYPMPIYQDWMRRTFTYLIPAAFLSYYPTLYFLDRADPLGLPGWTSFLAPVAGCGVLCAALLFWRHGLRHYQGTGS
ncbi:MAG TPA: ABC-2 family transporter protein [Armatimonadota bacterium]